MYSIYCIYNINNKEEVLYIGTTEENLLKHLNRYKRGEIQILKEYENKNELRIELLGKYDDIGYDRLSREGMWISWLKPKYNKNILYPETP